MPSFVQALTYTGWFLGLATISVLPLDISLAESAQDDSTTEEMEYILRIFWRCFYWLAFFFSFVLVPFVMHYEVSGEFDQRLRVRHAAGRVVRTYTIYACLGVVFLIFLWVKGAFDTVDFSLRGLLMAMGSAFGLL